jgi:alanine racemase
MVFAQHLIQRPTESVVDLDALAFNFHSAKKFIGDGLNFMAVVKADGYGHGAKKCARRLEAEGIDWFGVAIPEEGVDLRKAGIKAPILCLGSFWPGQAGLLTDHDLTPVIYDLKTAADLAQHLRLLGSTIDIHIKIDTGMHRVGVSSEDVPEFAAKIGQFGCFNVDGLMTHFASAEAASENEFTALQINRFDAAVNEFRKAGHSPTWIDLANSPGAIAHPESRGNMVRLGGALYGLVNDILPEATPQPELKPVLSLRSRIAHLRHLPPGESLGYGRTYFTSRDSVIALVPIGYADGYPRGRSNKAIAYVNGRLVPVSGRISMDWTLLDVTDVQDAAVGDEVYLIGGGPSHAVRAADLARELDTIGYEITCGISPRVPRVYVGAPAAVG